MQNIENFRPENQTLLRLASGLIVATGLLALSSCTGGSGENTSEPTPRRSIYLPNDPEPETYPTPSPSDETFEPEPSPRYSWPSEATIRAILKRGCNIANEQERKQYPDLWNNGLTEVSDDYDKAYHNQVSPDLFDKDLADFCPAYARLTDHGAG